MGKNSGLIVRVIKDNRIGRTKHSTKPINGKIAVYLCVGDPLDCNYSDKGTLFAPSELQRIGFID
jgi:hypothetical protein